MKYTCVLPVENWLKAHHSYSCHQTFVWQLPPKINLCVVTFIWQLSSDVHLTVNRLTFILSPTDILLTFPFWNSSDICNPASIKQLPAAIHLILEIRLTTAFWHPLHIYHLTPVTWQPSSDTIWKLPSYTLITTIWQSFCSSHLTFIWQLSSGLPLAAAIRQ